MLNTGVSRIDLMLPFDGTFSEFYAVNADGILGVTSPAILWLYDATECCNSTTGTSKFFHRHMYMGVWPMAPYPGNDHSIPYDSIAQASFAPWAFGFNAMRGRETALAHNLCGI